MLVITCGDPWSVNVELVAGCLSRPAGTWPVVVVGSRGHWDDQTQRLGISPFPLRSVSDFSQAANPGLWFLDCDGLERCPAWRPAETMSAFERGMVARLTLEKLKTLPAGGRMAVVTAPIDKSACHEAGWAFPGHTEFFEDLWQAPAVMMLAGPRLRVALATNHLSLAHVPKALSRAGLLRKMVLVDKSLRELFGIAKPRLAVCGLNPHCGDQGMFGDEESRLIAPAVADARELAKIEARGPLPADTVFHRALLGEFDAVLAMYHDQGLGPLKTVHFVDAVNVSGGLPHLRVSPDHGPAADLFLMGRASPDSMRAAIELAEKYLAQSNGCRSA